MIWIYVLLVACLGLAIVKMRRKRKDRERGSDAPMEGTANRAA